MRPRDSGIIAIAIAALTLLTIATTAVARPAQEARRAAGAEPSALWPFGKPGPQQRRYRHVQPASAHRPQQARRAPGRRLRLHELLQRELGTPSRPRPVRAVRHHRQPAARPAARPAVRPSTRRAVARAYRAVVVEQPAAALSGSSRAGALVAEARRYLGTNPTKRARLWCARFVNMVLERVGLPGTNSDAAKSFAYYGRRVSRPQFGAIAVLTRKGGGHVGIVTGVDRRGNPILIAGNNGRRKVGISVYPKRRVIAYVVPDGRTPDMRRIRQALR